VLPPPRPRVAASPYRCRATAPGDWIEAEHHCGWLVISEADWSCAAHTVVPLCRHTHICVCISMATNTVRARPKSVTRVTEDTGSVWGTVCPTGRCSATMRSRKAGTVASSTMELRHRDV